MSKKLRDFLNQELQNLEAAGLFQEGPVLGLESSQETKIKIGNKTVLNFASDNYLGWATDPRLIEAATQALKDHGVGWAAGRVVSGTHEMHKRLESSLSKFLKTSDSILFPTGYDACLGLFECLFSEEDYLFCDFSLQPSMVDGIRLCTAKQLIFKNNDMHDLEDKLKHSGNARFRAIILESVSPHDGKIAPLPEILSLAEKYDAIVILDDSHGIGVLGKNGKGTPEYYNLLGKIDLITGSFGYALGGGDLGFVSGRQDLVSWLRQKSRTYLFTSSPAPASLGAAEKALEIFMEEPPHELKRLQKISDSFRKELLDKRLDVVASEHPIISLTFGDAVATQTAANRLFQKGIYLLGFCFPVVPRGSAKIRIQLSAAHTDDDLKTAAHALEEVARGVQVLQG